MGAEGPDEIGRVEVSHSLEADLHPLRKAAAIGRDSDLAERLPPVGAPLHVELALVEDDVLVGRLEHVRGDLLRLVPDLLGGLEHGDAPHREGPAAVGAVAEGGAFGGVTVPQLDLVVRHPERVRDDLREGGVVALSV